MWDIKNRLTQFKHVHSPDDKKKTGHWTPFWERTIQQVQTELGGNQDPSSTWLRAIQDHGNGGLTCYSLKPQAPKRQIRSRKAWKRATPWHIKRKAPSHAQFDWHLLRKSSSLLSIIQMYRYRMIPIPIYTGPGHTTESFIQSRTQGPVLLSLGTCRVSILYTLVL